MVKVNPQKKIQRPRTEDEMRKALAALRVGAQVPGKAQDVDDSDVVLSDCIEELLEARRTIEDVRGFVQSMSTKLSRR